MNHGYELSISNNVDYLPVILRASLFNLLSVSLKLYFCFLSTVFALDLNAPTPRLLRKWHRISDYKLII